MEKFADRDISMVHMIPDFLVVIIPLIAGIILLVLNFSIMYKEFVSILVEIYNLIIILYHVITFKLITIRTLIHKIKLIIRYVS